MTVQEWIVSEATYGKEVFHAGIEGTRSGQDAFLEGRPLAPFVSALIRKAVAPAIFGACLAGLGSCARRRHGSVSQTVMPTLVGGAISFALVMAWNSRKLTASALASAFKKINKVRDEHWFERHPIDYA